MTQVFPHSSFLSAASLRILITATAVLLCIGMQWFPVSENTHFADEWLRDYFVRLQASDRAEHRVAVVDIDEASLAAIGPWPWSRAQITTLLESLLSDYGASGVALDMVLPEHADEAGDAGLASLARYGQVVMAQAFDYVSRPAPLRVGSLAGGVPVVGESNAPVANGFIANHAGLGQARLAGNIGFIPDEDGVLRRLPMITVFEGHEYPALSLALFKCCAIADGVAGSGAQNVEPFSRIPFSRNWSAYTVVSAADILNLRAPVTALSGRLILVGSSALGLSDRVATPLSTSTAGVMVHASQVSALLDAQAGVAPARWPGRWVAAAFSMLVAALAVYTFPRFSAASNMALLGGASLAWMGMAYLFVPHDAYFSLSGPLLTNLFLLVVAVPFDWQVAQRESHQLLATLRQYVAKSVVDELLRSKVKDPLAPVQREVTTLIADMEGYTGQVESLSMNEAVQLTRDFLDCLTRPVLKMGGTLDKYTGDGLVAFWGAPLPVAEHADLALDAAQQILLEVERFSLSRQKAGKPPLRVRIGVESGIAMAGDFGSSSRSIYTAVGDCVNIASRLQVLARDFPHDIVIGQGTVSCAKRHRFSLLGEVTLRGKVLPTTLYALEA